MNRASPGELRKCMDAAESMAASGLRFVPMPAMDEEDHSLLLLEMFSRLDKLEAPTEEL
jgi:hypothetical protein